MSKFHEGVFYGDEEEYAVSKERYTFEDAYETAAVELGTKDIVAEDKFVYYGFGNDNGELYNGWWLTDTPTGRCVPVWAFRRRS